MSQIPADLKYAKSHEWVKPLADGTVEMGISDHAQAALGDLVFVEVPSVGRTLAAGEACAVVESTKAASDVYSPLSGEVIAANEALADAPGQVNVSPYAEGWLFRLKLAQPGELAGLLDAGAYRASAGTD